MASIEKRGKNSYRLTVDLGYDSRGKRIRKRKTVKASGIREARKLAAQFRVEVESGEYISPEKLTVSQFISDWQKKYAIKHLSESTLETYLTHIKNHIKPELGHMRLDQVTPMHVIDFLDNLKRKDGRGQNLSIGTIQYIYRVLRNIFSRAEDWKIIKSNPVSSVERPKGLYANQKKPDVYDEDEVAILFKAIQDEPFHWRIMVTLALATGLRRGELLGLEWPHIDLEEGTIHVQQVIVRGRKGRPIIKSPKNNKSRTISLSKSVVEELKTYYLHWRKEKMKALDQWEETEHEFVLCAWNGKPFYPTTPTTWWRETVKRIGIRYIRLHDLRHTSATLLINQGVHAKIISARLGHADIRITMDTYGHALQSADKEAAEKIDSIFSNKTKGV